eukprot:m.157338 g.157338  ORF g.157338 m.157338 type:complete len:59 (-) comp17967_c0_seq1:1098-1274(-)
MFSCEPSVRLHVLALHLIAMKALGEDQSPQQHTQNEVQHGIQDLQDPEDREPKGVCRM